MIEIECIGKDMNLEELTNKIIEWGAEKGIYENSTYQHQLNKTLEEITELHKAIIGNNVDKIKDAIGDIYVTLVMAGQFDKRASKAIKEAFYADVDIVESTSLFEFSFLLLSVSSAIDPTQTQARVRRLQFIGMINRLNRISGKYNLDLKGCVEHAYNVISKRTGKMIDGQFVKDE